MRHAVATQAYELRHLPNQTYSIFVRLAKTKDATRAHADPCFAYRGYSVKAFVVGARSDDLARGTAQWLHTTRSVALPAPPDKIRAMYPNCDYTLSSRWQVI